MSGQKLCQDKNPRLHVGVYELTTLFESISAAPIPLNRPSSPGAAGHRTRQTKGCGSRLAILTMVFRLARQAEKHWRRINGHKLIEMVIKGVRYVDGEGGKAT